MRLTKPRKIILDLLSNSTQLKSAEMLHQELPEDTMNLSTVYRTLDTFFEQGLISKSFMNHTTYYYLNKEDHHHYMICMGCQKMYEMDCHIDHLAHDLAKNNHFKITHHDLTIYGYCESCQ